MKLTNKWRKYRGRIYFVMSNAFRWAWKNFDVILTFTFLVIYGVLIGQKLCLFVTNSMYSFLDSKYQFPKEGT